MAYSKGPYLFLRKRKGRKPCWVVRDRKREVSTQCGEEDRKGAEAFLKKYAKTYSITPNTQWHMRPAPARPSAEGTIYFISCEGTHNYPIKIGLTYNEVAERIGQIQMVCPYRVVVLATMRGGRGMERDLHWQFAGCRLQGEWFSRTPQLMAVIEMAKRGERPLREYPVVEAVS